jgi:hypothetical protein
VVEIELRGNNWFRMWVNTVPIIVRTVGDIARFLRFISAVSQG